MCSVPWSSRRGRNEGRPETGARRRSTDAVDRATRITQSVPSLAEIRAIGRRYLASSRGGPSDERKRQTADPDQWMDAVEQPFETVADVSTRLNDLESRFRAAGDRRSVFLTVYTKMTETVEAELDGDFFEDPEWVGTLLVTFANHYRRAVVGYERGRRKGVPPPWQVPPPWEVGFDAITGGRTIVIQDALLGINAHINYDLAYTLEAVGIDPDRPTRFADYVRINEILARLVDGVQVALGSVYNADLVGDLDALFGSVDEWLAGYGLAEGRDFAWDNAEHLVDRRWPFVRTYVNWRITSVSTGAAYLILGPSMDRSMQSQLRAAERRLSPVDEFQSAFDSVAQGHDPSRWSIPQ